MENAETYKNFRENWIKEADSIRLKIDEHFEVFCDVASILREPTRVEVPQGSWTFHPDPKFAYKLKED